jgi:hypothetical protein
MATSDSPDKINDSGLRCLRCGSAGVRVLREIRVASSSRFVDTRCLSCREQSVLKLAVADESQDAAAG